MSAARASQRDGPPVVVEAAGAITTVRLSRPRAHNALDRQGCRLLADIFEQLAQDASCRVVVLTGERSFSAGADLDEIERLPLLDKAHQDDDLLEGIRAHRERRPPRFRGL